MITIPKKILHKALMFASLYGPSSQEPAKHSLIGAVKLHVKNGRLMTFTKMHPVMSSMAHATYLDDDIKGDDEITIGEVCKVIGGRDEGGNSWKSVWERLDDPITISIDKNTVVFNKNQSYELSISLLKDSIAENNNVDKETFTKRIALEPNTFYILKDDKRVGSIFRITGKDLKSIVDDNKTMSSDYFEFNVIDEKQTILSMKLGNSSRSSRRKIELTHVDLDMGIIEAKFFNGIEAFAEALIEDEPFDIYYDVQQSKFTFYQNVIKKQVLFLEGGAAIDD